MSVPPNNYDLYHYLYPYVYSHLPLLLPLLQVMLKGVSSMGAMTFHPDLLDIDVKLVDTKGKNKCEGVCVCV
jgi:hypothetical protein